MKAVHFTTPLRSGPATLRPRFPLSVCGGEGWGEVVPVAGKWSIDSVKEARGGYSGVAICQSDSLARQAGEGGRRPGEGNGSGSGRESPGLYARLAPRNLQLVISTLPGTGLLICNGLRRSQKGGYWAGMEGKGTTSDLQQDGDIDSIVIIRPNKYAEKQEARAARQLAKGAFHLAELLNKIQWQ